MELHYLIFEASDDGGDIGTWEAMASARGNELARVLEEVEVVMQAALAQAPGVQGPLDEGGVWDADVQQQAEAEWVTVTLTLTGPWAWGESLVRSFAAE